MGPKRKGRGGGGCPSALYHSYKGLASVFLALQADWSDDDSDLDNESPNRGPRRQEDHQAETFSENVRNEETASMEGRSGDNVSEDIEVRLEPSEERGTQSGSQKDASREQGPKAGIILSAYYCRCSFLVISL